MKILRFDPLAGCPDLDPNVPGRGLLSVDDCADWEAVSAKLATRGVEIPAAQLRDFSATDPGNTITFSNREFLIGPNSGYLAQINYVIDPTTEATCEAR